MSITALTIILVACLIIGIILALKGIDDWKDTYKKIGLLVLVCSIICLFSAHAAIYGAKCDINNAEVYNFKLEETSYIDCSKEVLLSESLGVGHSLKYVSVNGSDSSIVLSKKYDRYEIIFSEEESRVELYSVTAKYKAAFFWDEEEEKYYKIYIDRESLSSEVSAEE